MVLRSGIIIPFQFRDAKKLLMIGVPEENRDLSIFDLKNVVRAAFGIYNFEFRNKKIGFNIPDDLLLHYLAQRHDLTNFVIEVGQANDAFAAAVSAKEPLSFEPSCSSAGSAQKQQNVATPQKSNESTSDYAGGHGCGGAGSSAAAASGMKRARSPPLEVTTDRSTNNDDSTPPPKIRISQVYSEQTPESLTQSIDPMDIIPKSEDHEEVVVSSGGEMDARDLARYEARELAMQQQQLQLQQQHQQQQQHLHHQQSHFFANYAAAHAGIPVGGHQTHASQQQYSPAMMNRYRRRGERMSKDQKELYVKYFEENPCMLTQRRNDIVLEPHWNKLANMLNSVQQGACKNVEEWKQTFDAWRYRVFMYTRYNSRLTGAAAQNPKNYKPLTPTDQRAYAMWTSHKNTAPQDFEKMDMFAHLDETQAGDYDY